MSHYKRISKIDAYAGADVDNILTLGRRTLRRKINAYILVTTNTGPHVLRM